MKTAKRFDCVKMKDDAQRERAEAMRGLSLEARLEFYRQAHEALLRHQKQLQDAAEPRESRPVAGTGDTHTTANDTR